MQFTTAYAPTAEDLEEDFFGAPIITMARAERPEPTPLPLAEDPALPNVAEA